MGGGDLGCCRRPWGPPHSRLQKEAGRGVGRDVVPGASASPRLETQVTSEALSPRTLRCERRGRRWTAGPLMPSVPTAASSGGEG